MKNQSVTDSDSDAVGPRMVPCFNLIRFETAGLQPQCANFAASLRKPVRSTFCGESLTLARHRRPRRLSSTSGQATARTSCPSGPLASSRHTLAMLGHCAFVFSLVSPSTSVSKLSASDIEFDLDRGIVLASWRRIQDQGPR